MKILLHVAIWTIITVGQAQNSIEVRFDEKLDKAYAVHRVQAKETLYGIAMTYGLDVASLMQANHLVNPDLSIGMEVRIPFSLLSISYKNMEGILAPLVYTVRKKETLFSICRRYFNANMAEIKEINQLRNANLYMGQQLIIGYLDTHGGLSPNLEARTVESKPELLYSDDVAWMNTTSIPSEKSEVLTMQQEKGAALWDKHSTGLSGNFVLHRYASPNTWIEITNPMYSNSVSARVIGSIPTERFDDDVLVILSPALARQLGAIDEKFFVKIRYLMPQSKLTKG